MLVVQPEAGRTRCVNALDGTQGSQQVFSSVSLRIYNHRPGNETQTDPVPGAEDALQQPWLGDSRHPRCEKARAGTVPTAGCGPGRGLAEPEI